MKYWKRARGTSEVPEKKFLPMAKRASPSASKPNLSLMKMLIKMKKHGFDIRIRRNDKVK